MAQQGKLRQERTGGLRLTFYCLDLCEDYSEHGSGVLMIKVSPEQAETSQMSTLKRASRE